MVPELRRGGVVRRLHGAARPAAMLWVCCAILFAAAAAAESGNAPPRRPVQFGGAEAIGLLSWPSAAALARMEAGPSARPPAVLVVHDAMGIDGRAEGYVQQLLGAGFAVLEMELAPVSLDGAGEPLPDDVAAADRVGRALAALAAEADPSRIGVLGFGVGARAAALMPAGFEEGSSAARVLLYPGCAAVRHAVVTARPSPRLPSSPILLLHGEEDPANSRPDCAALAATLEETAPVRRTGYAGAGYAWDLPAVGGLERTRLVGPDGRGIVTARHWPELAEFAAAQVAAFFCRAFGDCR